MNYTHGTHLSQNRIKCKKKIHFSEKSDILRFNNTEIKWHSMHDLSWKITVTSYTPTSERKMTEWSRIRESVLYALTG